MHCSGHFGLTASQVSSPIRLGLQRERQPAPATRALRRIPASTATQFTKINQGVGATNQFELWRQARQILPSVPPPPDDRSRRARPRLGDHGSRQVNTRQVPGVRAQQWSAQTGATTRVKHPPVCLRGDGRVCASCCAISSGALVMQPRQLRGQMSLHSGQTGR
jgi:hypothetical protein